MENFNPTSPVQSVLPKSPRRQLPHWVYPVGLLVIAVVICLPSIGDRFLSDDYDHLMFARSVDSVRSFLDIFKIPGDVYRPVMHLSVLLDYSVWGYQPAGFHLTNTVLLALTTLLLYGTLRALGANRPLSFFAGAVFALFPNHHESVTWIAGRTDVLATFFYLLSLYSFVKLVRTGRWRWLAPVYVAAIFAYFSKEIGATLPLAAAVLYVVYLRRRSVLKLRTAIYAWLPYLVTLAGYLIVRRIAIGSWIGGYSMFGQSSATALSPKVVLLPLYLVKYLVNFDYLSHLTGWATVPTSRFASTAAAACIVALLTGAAAINWRRLREKVFWRNVALATVALYVVTLPGLSILPALRGNLMNTRILYLASVPLAILLSYLLFNSPGERYRLKAMVATGMCVLLAAASVLNYVPWRLASNEVRAMEDSIRHLHPEFATISYATYDRELFFKNLTDSRYGAFVFRNGFGEHLRILFANKNLFVNPKEKIVWVVPSGLKSIGAACSFTQNVQTTGVQLFRWDPAGSQFIEEGRVAELYAGRESARRDDAASLVAFAEQRWSREGATFDSRGRGDTLTAPAFGWPPAVFSRLSFTLATERAGVAELTWQTTDGGANGIVLPTSA
ncbi:MAG: glycosyltransferase family 39 protein, partial [Patescibacteria group bacterium]